MARGLTRCCSSGRCPEGAAVKRRVALIVAIAIGLGPSTWLRSDWVESGPLDLTITPISAELPASTADGAITREGLWKLSSPLRRFYGFSALVTLSGGNLRAFTDGGMRLTFAPPGNPPRETRFNRVLVPRDYAWEIPDIESATRDPQTGDYWLGWENFHAIGRFSVASQVEAMAVPPEFADWPVNSGNEAMERLADGRFLILPENGAPARLWAGDPLEDAPNTAFRFDLPDNFRPTEIAQIPDGRVLILMRRIDWSVIGAVWPPFGAKLAIADPATISEGEVWAWEELADLDTILPRENYEAMSVWPEEDGSVTVWIMSDDNRAATQRTLLAKLRFQPTPPPDLPN